MLFPKRPGEKAKKDAPRNHRNASGRNNPCSFLFAFAKAAAIAPRPLEALRIYHLPAKVEVELTASADD